MLWLYRPTRDGTFFRRCIWTQRLWYRHIRTVSAILYPTHSIHLTAHLRSILKDWSIIDRLNRVRVPSFVIHERKDIAQDLVVASLRGHTEGQVGDLGAVLSHTVLGATR
ncbi:hypothetical protein C8Q72DRAFT_643023 [Fomitopsis betulina]|nr:hypothetical protein C8Q72DRAFT_643023 [Fomitopsis betulina]